MVAVQLRHFEPACGGIKQWSNLSVWEQVKKVIDKEYFLSYRR